MVVKPYTETVEGNTRTRVLQENVDLYELVWHRDKKDRLVKVLQSDGWMFQYDNGLPFELIKDDLIVILKETYHRVIKGQGDLVIEINEFE